jgi:hypothetical protein
MVALPSGQALSDAVAAAGDDRPELFSESMAACDE